MSCMETTPLIGDFEWYYVQVTYTVTGTVYKAVAFWEGGRWYISGQNTDLWSENPETFKVKIMSRIDLDTCKFEGFRH